MLANSRAEKGHLDELLSPPSTVILRLVVIFGAVVLASACGLRSDPRIARRVGPDFREHCDSFESVTFAEKVVAAVRGSVLGGDPQHQRLQGAQIAARDLATGMVSYAASRSDGSFAIEGLTPGRFEVWTCLDGFDEVRFPLVLDPESPAKRIDLYLAASESAGRAYVVAQ